MKSVVSIITVLACLVAASLDARADAIQTRGKMLFGVPFHDGGWDQAWVGPKGADGSAGPIKRARDIKDAPTLTIFVISADDAGTPEQVEAKLAALVSQDGVEVGGTKVTTATFAKGKDETVSVKIGYGASATKGDATLRTTTGTVNNKPVLVAIASFEGETNVLLGIPEADSAKELFETVIHGLSITGRKKTKPTAPPPPEVRPIALVKDVTASSTKADKTKKDAYGAWQAVASSRGWCEGKPDGGAGESLTITLDHPIKLKRLELASEPKSELGVGLDGGPDVVVAPESDATASTVDVKRAVTTIKVTITKPGKAAKGDTCLSVRLDNEEGWVLAPIRGLEPAAAAAIPGAVAAIQGALFEDGRPKLESLVAFPLSVRAAGARAATKHKDWASVTKACAADSTGPKCPQMAAAQNASGWFVEPSYASGVLELVFPGGFRDTSEDVWRLRWIDGAWKLVAIDVRAKTAGEEGDAP